MINISDFVDEDQFYAAVKRLPTGEYLAIMYKLSVDRLKKQGLDDATYAKLLDQDVSTLDSQDKAYKLLEEVAAQFQKRPEVIQYEALLARISKGAEYLERTDLSEAEREKGEKLYEQLCQEAADFRAICSDLLDSTGTGNGPNQAREDPQRVA